MNPIDYSINNVPSPLDAFNESLKSGASILALQQQQALSQQQNQRKLDLQNDLVALGANPTPKDIVRVSIKYPELSEHHKRNYDMLGSEQQKSKLESAIPIYAAVSSGNYEVAAGELTRHADALENSGNKQEAAQTRAMARLVKEHPETAKITMGLLLSSTMGADKFASTFGGLGEEARKTAEAPADLKTKEANASAAQSGAIIKGAEASNAQKNIRLDNQTKEEKIITEQYNRKLAELDRKIALADSETKRGQLQLERDKLVAEQNKFSTEKTESSQSKLDNINLSLETVQKILNHPGLKDVGTFTGKIASLIPGSDRNSFIALVDTLKSQQFSTNIQTMVKMGSLSDAEGKKMETLVASLSLDQSARQFRESVGTIQATLKKGLSRELDSGRAPTKGGAYVTKHPTFGDIKEGDINRMLTANPGATREQAIEYLKQTGASNSSGATGSY